MGGLGSSRGALGALLARKSLESNDEQLKFEESNDEGKAPSSFDSSDFSWEIDFGPPEGRFLTFRGLILEPPKVDFGPSKDRFWTL